MARGRPRRLRGLPAGRRGGRATSSTRRRSRASRARSASRSSRTRAGRRPRSTCSRPRGRPASRRFMFAASSSAYGDTEELPKHEAMLPSPLSPYAAGKLAGEHYVSVYAQTMGLDGVSLRYFNVFGPRQDPSSPYSGVISLFARSMSRGPAADHLRRRPPDPRLHLRGQRRRRQPRRRCAGPSPLGGEVLNVGTGRRISLLDLVAAINADPRHRPRARVPGPRDGRRPRLAGQPRPDPGRPRLRAACRLRGGLRRTRRGDGRRPGNAYPVRFAMRTLPSRPRLALAIEMRILGVLLPDPQQRGVQGAQVSQHFLARAGVDQPRDSRKRSQAGMA